MNPAVLRAAAAVATNPSLRGKVLAVVAAFVAAAAAAVVFLVTAVIAVAGGSTAGVTELVAGLCGSTFTPALAPAAAGSLPPVADIPPDYLHLYRAASDRYQVPWPILAGIGKAETDHGRSQQPGVRSGANFAGAMGPMQFLAATWQAYGVDGDRNGTVNVYDPADAIPAAAAYLKAHEVNTNPQGAIFAYNHASWYVDLVERNTRHYTTAARRAGLSPQPSPGLAGQVTSVDCTGLQAGGLLAAAPGSVRKVLAFAFAARGGDYFFGGDCTDPHGPVSAHHCDCSSLVQQAFAQVGVRLPRTADEQVRFAKAHGQVVPIGQERPGDLVAYATYLGPTVFGHIGIVVDGEKHLMINAPKTGAQVRVEPFASRASRPLFTIVRLLKP